MKHFTRYNPEMDMIETEVEGEINEHEMKEIFGGVLKLIEEKNCKRVLTDYRKARLKLSSMDIYNFPKAITDTGASHGVDAHQIRRAWIIADNMDDFRFWETVSLNSGQPARIFFSVDEAREWLK